VDGDAAAEQGIVFCNTPDGPTESTAEHAVALLMAVAKRVIPGHLGVSSGGWPARSELMGTEVQGKTLGLVGLGRIGRRVAQICGAGLGMRVVGSDPFVSAEAAAQMGVELLSQEEVIAQADFLSLHAPAIPATHKMINRESIARMKTGTYLINVARGPLVDDDSLIEALDSGKLAGAGIDVFDPEPPAADAPIRFHPKIVLTPHIASVTGDGRARIERMAIERALEFFDGQKPKDVCNPKVFEFGLRG
jgi:phosphoglycerate dehydrogenase-like enzyme